MLYKVGLAENRSKGQLLAFDEVTFMKAKTGYKNLHLYLQNFSISCYKNPIYKNPHLFGEQDHPESECFFFLIGRELLSLQFE